MLLAIDSGNTNTVFAVFDDDGEKRGERRAATNATPTASLSRPFPARLTAGWSRNMRYPGPGRRR